jgi:hypothetical protein
VRVIHPEQSTVHTNSEPTIGTDKCGIGGILFLIIRAFLKREGGDTQKLHWEEGMVNFSSSYCDGCCWVMRLAFTSSNLGGLVIRFS